MLFRKGRGKRRKLKVEQNREEVTGTTCAPAVEPVEATAQSPLQSNWSTRRGDSETDSTAFADGAAPDAARAG